MAEKKTCPITMFSGYGKLCLKEDCAWWDDHPDRQQCTIVSLVHLIGIEDELEMGRRNDG